MRIVFIAAILVASGTSYASVATTCNTNLLGPAEDTSVQQFMNLSRTYLGTLGGRAEQVVNFVVNSQRPVNPVQTAMSSKDLQFQHAFARYIVDLPSPSWIEIQNGFSDWKKSHLAIKVDEAEKKTVTSTIAQLGYLDRYDIQGGDKVTAHIVVGDTAYLVVEQYDSSVLISIDLKDGSVDFISGVCGERRSCFPSFTVGKNNQVYLVTSLYKKIEIFKVGKETELFLVLETEGFNSLLTSTYKLPDGRIIVARAGADKTSFYEFDETHRKLNLFSEIPWKSGTRWQPDYFLLGEKIFFLNQTDGSKVVVYEVETAPLQVKYAGRLAVTRPNRKPFRVNNTVSAFEKSGSVHVAFTTSERSNESRSDQDDRSVLHVFDLGKSLTVKRSYLNFQRYIVATEKTLPIKMPIFSSMAVSSRGQKTVITTTDWNGLQVSELTPDGQLKKSATVDSTFAEKQITNANDILGRDFVMSFSDSHLNYYEVTPEGNLVAVDRYKINHYNESAPPLYLKGTKNAYIVIVKNGVEILTTTKAL